MEKILILGNELSTAIKKQFNAELIDLKDINNTEDDVIHGFIVKNLRQQFSILIIDADNISTPEISLSIAMHLRLSISDLGNNALCPIIITSDKRIRSFMHHSYLSQILLTRNVYFQSRTKIEINEVEALETRNYFVDFFDYVCIPSGPTIGRHSLANQWGANILGKLVSSNFIYGNNDIQKSLYFKYIQVKKLDNISDTIQNRHNTTASSVSRINATGKKILLIDDEAITGQWDNVLKNMLFNHDSFDIIAEQVPNYESLSLDARQKIENNDYDLILLDLRMNGIREEFVLDPDKFSGMDILREIKRLNKGTQVIMFTASNKAWNIKSLLDTGADGYYIKESPEMLFPTEVSQSNYTAFQRTINRCFERSYLRDIYKSIIQIINSLPDTNFGKTIAKQLHISYYLISKAESDEQFAFAYISLYMVIEIINKEKIKVNALNNTIELKSNNQPIKAWSIEQNQIVDYTQKDNTHIVLTDINSSEWQKITGIIKQEWFLNYSDLKIIDLQKRIQARNWFIHNNEKLKLKDSKGKYVYVIQNELFNQKGFISLFGFIKDFCNNL